MAPGRHSHREMYGLAGHPDHYDRLARRVGERLYRRIARDVVSEGLPARAAVLDVGTGPGRVPLLIAEAAPELQVLGIDIAPEMIEHARAAAAAASHDPGMFQVADVAALPYSDGSIDLVVSSLSLHHWPDRSAGLRDIARVLRHGGSAWIYDLRWVLRRSEPAAASLGLRVHREAPLAGTRWFNPVGRLVIEA